MPARSSKRVKMKTVNKIKDKKLKTIKKPKVKPKKEKVLIVAQEIKFARLLSGNEKKTRDRVLKTFKKWLLNCFAKGYEFKEDDFTRVWKGLFYAVWMSDKPLVQEELCETIAGILDLFPPEQLKYALMMTKAGFKVLAAEWYGIDHHRMDKYLMLVRRYLRGSLRCLRRSEWNERACRLYADMLAGTDGVLCPKTPLYARNAGSMLMHIVDCFLEELSKVSEGNIPDKSLITLLRPFSAYMVRGESPTLVVSARRLHTALLRQSEQGLEYQGKTKAWEMMGCPRGGPDALELASDDDGDDDHTGDGSDDDEHNSSKPLDPRAGRVDVVLSPLPVPARLIADMLRELLATASSKAHKRTKICLERFEQLSNNQYPLRVPDASLHDDTPHYKPTEAAEELRRLERELVENADELALRGLSRKHRKRLLAKSRAGLSIIEDRPATNGNWEVESTEPAEKKSKLETDTSNKENVHSKKDKKSKKRKHSDENTNKHGKIQKTSAETNNKNKETDNKTQKNNKSYEKPVAATSSSKNKKLDKKQILLNSLKDKKLDKNKKPREVTNKKDKTDANKQTTIEKHKKPKETSPTKQMDKHAKKKQTTETTEQVLTKSNKQNSKEAKKEKTSPSLVVNKVKNYQKKTGDKTSPQKKVSYDTPKKVKFVLKNNSMQGPVDYYKSVRQSPNIPFDSSKRPTKTNLKVSTPSPINPFFKKKLRLK